MKKIQPEAPVIVITAFGSEEIQRKTFEKGANAYLEKPIHFQKLRTLIHDLFSKQCLITSLSPTNNENDYERISPKFRRITRMITNFTNRSI